MTTKDKHKMINNELLEFDYYKLFGRFDQFSRKLLKLFELFSIKKQIEILKKYDIKELA